MPRAAGSDVTYRQGGIDYPISAWPAQNNYEVLGTDGLLTKIIAFDWCFEANTLPVKPRPGDVIEASGVRYEVLPLGQLPCFQNLDVEGISILVHTKRLHC